MHKQSVHRLFIQIIPAIRLMGFLEIQRKVQPQESLLIVRMMRQVEGMGEMVVQLVHPEIQSVNLIRVV